MTIIKDVSPALNAANALLSMENGYETAPKHLSFGWNKHERAATDKIDDPYNGRHRYHKYAIGQTHEM